jgi:hypothetical protein
MGRNYVFVIVGCVIGILIASWRGGWGTVTAQGSPNGRYAITSVQWDGVRALVVVLDTATGNVQPYFHGGTHDGVRFFPIGTEDQRR